jgi:hypothetical protein
MQVKLSAIEWTFLHFIEEVDGRSPDDLVHDWIRAWAEGEHQFCLDPSKSEFRRWLVERDPQTFTEPCDAAADAPCTACAAWLADDPAVNPLDIGFRLVEGRGAVSGGA